MKTNSSTSNILIKVNGENKSIPQNISILNLLETYKLNKDRVVIELNRTILKQSDFENTTLTESDELEIIAFVGGG